MTSSKPYTHQMWSVYFGLATLVVASEHRLGGISHVLKEIVRKHRPKTYNIIKAFHIFEVSCADRQATFLDGRYH